MPAKNPRITITLKPSTHAVLQQMSELTRNSQSSIVGELLSQAEPIFERMVRVMQLARDAQGQSKDRFLSSLESVQGVLERQLGLMEGEIESRSMDMLDELEQVHRRNLPAASVSSAAGAVADGRPNPPHLTGGVQTPPDRDRTAAQKARKPVRHKGKSAKKGRRKGHG